MAQELSLISLFLLSLIALTVNGVGGCPWEVRLKTGDEPNADTRANIYIDAPKVDGLLLRIGSLRQYGAEGPDYPYFRRNQLDIFRFEGPCYLPCVNIFHNDGFYLGPSWFLASAYVRVETGRENVERNVTVNKWILQDSVVPYVYDLPVNFCQGNEK